MIKVSNKNKIIVSIIIMLMMLIIMSVSSLAWVGYPNTPSSELFDESYIYQVIYDHGSDVIYLAVSQTPFYIYQDRWNNYRIRTSSDIYTIKYENGNWDYWRNLGTGQHPGITEILESTHDVYTDSTLQDVFFSATRIIPTLETLTKHPPLTLMTPLIRGIIPFLIGLLIASVGFWKAWQFLFKTLRKA